MHLWDSEKWIKDPAINCQDRRTGLRLRFQPGIDPEVRRACMEFCKWIRKEFYFPVRIPIYFKASKAVKAMDGEMVSATFLGPFDRYQEPYIRISVGDYADLLKDHCKDDALCIILHSVAHELTHYFQWINGFNYSDSRLEKQALSYSDYIVDDYAQTRDHP